MTSRHYYNYRMAKYDILNDYTNTGMSALGFDRVSTIN